MELPPNAYGDQAAQGQRLNRHPCNQSISALVLAELATGAGLETRKAETLAAVRDLTASMTPIPFTTDNATTYARIRATLAHKGKKIDSMDCLIAAQAVTRGLVLVTDKLREYRRVPGLQYENWIR